MCSSCYTSDQGPFLIAFCSGRCKTTLSLLLSQTHLAVFQTANAHVTRSGWTVAQLLPDSVLVRALFEYSVLNRCCVDCSVSELAAIKSALPLMMENPGSWPARWIKSDTHNKVKGFFVLFAAFWKSKNLLLIAFRVYSVYILENTVMRIFVMCMTTTVRTTKTWRWLTVDSAKLVIVWEYNFLTWFQNSNISYFQHVRVNCNWFAV